MLTSWTKTVVTLLILGKSRIDGARKSWEKLAVDGTPLKELQETVFHLSVAVVLQCSKTEECVLSLLKTFAYSMLFLLRMCCCKVLEGKLLGFM